MDFFREDIPIERETEIEKYVLPVRPGRADKRKLVKVKSAVTFNYRFVKKKRCIVQYRKKIHLAVNFLAYSKIFNHCTLNVGRNDNITVPNGRA